MKLVTKELQAKFPNLYANEEKQASKVKVIAKFFTPWGRWTWYPTEFDGDDTFFGFVRGQDNELGYFSLSELEGVTGPGGLRIERDRYFANHTLADVMERQL